MLGIMLGLLLAPAATQPICLIKLIKNGSQSMGDRVVAVVADTDMPTLRREGFIERDCRQLITKAVRFRNETCRMAAKANPKRQAAALEIYGVSPQTLCDGTKLMRPSK